MGTFSRLEKYLSYSSRRRIKSRNYISIPFALDPLFIIPFYFLVHVVMVGWQRLTINACSLYSLAITKENVLLWACTRLCHRFFWNCIDAFYTSFLFNCTNEFKRFNTNQYDSSFSSNSLQCSYISNPFYFLYSNPLF